MYCHLLLFRGVGKTDDEVKELMNLLKSIDNGYNIANALTHEQVAHGLDCTGTSELDLEESPCTPEPGLKERIGALEDDKPKIDGVSLTLLACDS